MSPMNEICFKSAVISKCDERIEIGIEDSTISNALCETTNLNDPARLYSLLLILILIISLDPKLLSEVHSIL